jgi:Macro domain
MEQQRSALRRCYQSCLERAQAMHVRSVTFCAVSTGVFVPVEAFWGYWLTHVEHVRFGDGRRRVYEILRDLVAGNLKRRGAMIGANDLFIAAHARASGLTLVTNNMAEFERVKDLVIENWALPGRRKR